MNDFGTGVLRYATTHQVPLWALADGHALQRWKSRDWHHYGAPVLQVHLKLSPLGERQPLNLRLHIPISFCLVHTLFCFLNLNHPDSLSLFEKVPLTEQFFTILLCYGHDFSTTNIQLYCDMFFIMPSLLYIIR